MLGESRCINYWTVINRDEHLCWLEYQQLLIDKKTKILIFNYEIKWNKILKKLLILWLWNRLNIIYIVVVVMVENVEKYLILVFISKYWNVGKCW